MTTKPVQIDLWKLVAALMGSGAFGGGVTAGTLQSTMAVAEARIARNASDISELRGALESQIDRMQMLNITMAQTVTRLEALSK